MRASIHDRFWAKVEGRLADDCWVWRAGRTPKGYGKFYIGHVAVYAHRVVYESAFGRIPDGFEIDHLCRNPSCVNPAHLEAVTRRVNALRGFSPPAMNARKTHCPRGHAYTTENTKVERRVECPDGNGSRKCLVCRRANARARWAKRMAIVRGRP